ncbi:restriction endonuclease subunit S [Bacillus sp. FSL L8-0099]|uniref:restriction endonuclease subunit S n=1 Tax=unclassified Bacillus (in: firmicutes) TaxID=185979 RepID=UPI0030F7E574
MNYKLGDLFKFIRNGANIKQGIPGGYPITRIETISKGEINRNKMGYAGIEDITGYEKYILQDGDILTSHINSEIHLGKSALYKKINDELIIHGMNLLCLRADQNIVLPKYIIYLFQTLEFKKSLNKIIKKSVNQASFAVADFKKLNVSIPSIGAQEKIIAILEDCEVLIKKRQSQIAALDELTQSLFLEMFGDPIYNTRNWIKVCFGDVINVLTDYHANGSYQVLKNHVELLDEENYALMIRTTDLEHQNYTEDVKYITEEAYNFLTKTQVFGGEIIINKIGSAGKVYIMPNLNRPVSLGMNQFMIRVNSKANNRFIYYLLNTKAGQNLIQKRVQGAVTKSITKDAVRSIPIILPPIDLQNEFDNNLEQINSHKNLLQNSLQSIQELHQSLLQKAFKGELFQEQI